MSCIKNAYHNTIMYCEMIDDLLEDAECGHDIYLTPTFDLLKEMVKTIEQLEHEIALKKGD